MFSVHTANKTPKQTENVEDIMTEVMIFDVPFSNSDVFPKINPNAHYSLQLFLLSEDWGH